MKTKYWIFLITALFVLCAGVGTALLIPRTPAGQARILQDGELLYTVDLSIDQTYVISSEHGSNTVTVKDGCIAVTEADCPDQYCVQRGWCSSGADIVCLPHRLVIQFSSQEVDAVTGR